MRLLFVAAALAATVVAVPAAQAVEPFKVYDRFSDPTIDPGRWFDTEKARFVKNGVLHLMQRTWGNNASDFNFTTFSWNSSFTNPQYITQMRARIIVDGVESSPCPANSLVGDARARIAGGFFNIGTATPGSMVNDVFAQLRLIRLSNSSDAPGVLRVQGLVSLCTNVDCSTTVPIENVADLGTVTLGTPTTLQLIWDQAARTFQFSRDGGPPSTVGYTYAVSNPPGVTFRQLGTRVNAPNCFSAPRVSGMIDARFDNVFVNQTALP